MGGLTPAGTSSADILRIDPATGKTLQIATLAQGAHDAGGAVLGNRFFVFGGGADSVLGSVQEFHPGQNQARIVGRLPRLRADLSVAGTGDLAYVVGGFDGSTADPAVLSTTDGATFSTVADLPRPVRYAAAAVMGGYLWVFGGVQASSPSTAIQRVDPRTGKATVVGNLPVPLDHAVALVLGGTLLVLGGVINGQPSSIIWRLDPMTGSVTQTGTLPTAVSMPAAVVVGEVAYLVGGEGQGTLDTVVEVRPTN